MKIGLQTLLDNFYYFRKYLGSVLAWVTFRAYGKEIAFADVKAGRLRDAATVDMNLDAAKDIDLLLSITEESVADAVERRKVATDKCKTLLTLGSLLFGIVGLLLPKYLAFDSYSMRGLAIFGIALLFNAIVLLLMFFDIGEEMVQGQRALCVR